MVVLPLNPNLLKLSDSKVMGGCPRFEQKDPRFGNAPHCGSPSLDKRHKSWTFHCCINLCHERKMLGATRTRASCKLRIVACFGFALALRVFALVVQAFVPVLRVCFHMCPRNRLYEKREAAATAKNARIQICAPSPEKRPTRKWLLPTTQGTHTHTYVTNEGPGY